AHRVGRDNGIGEFFGLHDPPGGPRRPNAGGSKSPETVKVRARFRVVKFVFDASTAIHLPRRRISNRRNGAPRTARRRSRSWLRKIPDKIAKPPSLNIRATRGKISISKSLNKFAETTSNFSAAVTVRTSPRRNSTWQVLFSRASPFAVEMAIGSSSIAWQHDNPAANCGAYALQAA